MTTTPFQDASFRLNTPNLVAGRGSRTQEVLPALLPSDPEDEYDGPVPLPKTSHPWPVRVSLIVLGCAVVLLNGAFHLGISDTVILALIGLITAGVAGDTVRPSGMAPPAKAKPLPKDR